MPRLIDADALKMWIDCGHLRPPTELCFSELDVVRMLDKQPTIDAEPVRHGRWITIQHIGGVNWYETTCSECKTSGSPKWKRCPVCEAKMGLEVQDG